MAQLVKCLLLEHEEPSSDLLHSDKIQIQYYMPVMLELVW